VIIDAFEKGGVRIDRVVACGGLTERNYLLLQIYAYVTGRTFRMAASAQAPALGSAIFATVAARRTPLCAEDVRLHDMFGRGGDPAVKTLTQLRRQVAMARVRSSLRHAADRQPSLNWPLTPKPHGPIWCGGRQRS
jgi:ribulose kinase